MLSSNFEFCGIYSYGICYWKRNIYWFGTVFLAGWPRTLENRENGEKKFPAGKNQGVWNFAENQGKIREFQKILSL